MENVCMLGSNNTIYTSPKLIFSKEMSRSQKKMNNNKKKHNNKKNQKDTQGEESLDQACVVSVSSSPSDTTSDGPLSYGVAPPDNKPHMRCKFHRGRLQSKVRVYMSFNGRTTLRKTDLVMLWEKFDRLSMRATRVSYPHILCTWRDRKTMATPSNQDWRETPILAPNSSRP